MIRLINILSIDVAFGAIAMMYLWSYYFNQTISTMTYLALFLVVWLIYTTDHLLDVKKRKNLIGSRYSFHQLHFKLLSWLCLLGVVLLLYVSLHLNYYLLYHGAIVFGGVVFHFFLSHLKKNKEEK